MRTIFAAIVLASALPFAVAEAPTEMPAAEVEAATLVTAKVKGMVCDFCAQAVTKVFGKEDAVESVDVDLDHGEIRVTLVEGQSITDDRVEDLVKKSGYALVSIERATS